DHLLLAAAQQEGVLVQRRDVGAAVVSRAETEPVELGLAALDDLGLAVLGQLGELGVDLGLVEPALEQDDRAVLAAARRLAVAALAHAHEDLLDVLEHVDAGVLEVGLDLGAAEQLLDVALQVLGEEPGLGGLLDVDDDEEVGVVGEVFVDGLAAA